MTSRWPPVTAEGRFKIWPCRGRVRGLCGRPVANEPVSGRRAGAPFQYLSVQKTGARQSVGLIQLNRPQALNALCEGLMEELSRALEAMESDPQVGAIVITGSQKAFAGRAERRTPPRVLAEGGWCHIPVLLCSRCGHQGDAEQNLSGVLQRWLSQWLGQGLHRPQTHHCCRQRLRRESPPPLAAPWLCPSTP